MHFDIEKEKQNVKFMLEKRQLPKLTAEVVIDLDVSGSTQGMYLSGIMQNAVQRIVPVVLNFDDNGDAPVYTFNDGNDFDLLNVHLTAKNYSDYVSKQIVRNGSISRWGGTAYAPVLVQNLRDVGLYATKPATVTAPKKGFFGAISSMISHESTSGHETFQQKSRFGFPLVVQFITDGDNEDRDKDPTRNLLKACADSNVPAYFNFIGVGDSNFYFLKEIGDAYPNVGFAQIVDIEKASSDESIYEYLIPKELTTWLHDYMGK
jgi:hypothetical protein